MSGAEQGFGRGIPEPFAGAAAIAKNSTVYWPGFDRQEETLRLQFSALRLEQMTEWEWRAWALWRALAGNRV
ncbi:MAG: hypothetical protein WB710_21125, partial [Stellaceae bacterium]